MSKRTEIRVAGFGGQGVILAGHILGRASTIHENKFATLTQSYGPESRGSACSAQIVVSDAEIFYPALIQADILMVMSQEAETKFSNQVKKEGMILYDSSLVAPGPGLAKYAGIPATQLAQQLGKKIVANMIMLGFLARQTGAVSLEVLRQAVLGMVAKQHLDINLKALQAGYSYKPSTPITIET